MDNKAEKQEMLTNSKGQVQFTVEQKGSWLLNVIWAVPSPNQNEAEFETYFSSLNFGY